MHLHFVLSGLLVGTLVGLTGVGGGSLMTPLLTLLFGVSPSVAVGTDLAFASITKGAGTWVHRLRGTVNHRIVYLLCAGSLPTAGLTILALHYHGAVDGGLVRLIKYSIAASVLLTVLFLLLKSRILHWLSLHPERHLHGRTLDLATVCAGAVIGCLVTLSSIGAGVIGATLLSILYPRMRTAEIAGTDIAYAVPLTAVAALGHWWLGTIDFALLLSLLMGSVPGITVGSYLSRSVPEHWLRGTLATVLTLVAAKMIFS
ncbi:sulfite exporter TauE/SafE family protein [Parvibium lacunae]|uniref:Probable membrane transporter protein n=1 Tax=Parvibium lacunae TaxID=1888893 RepID=A0A368KYL6_9BURK|nr:sulfite exporter TauE/SafE family protein [Parvibium lacunae]RCS56513.1 sulfite exporter TauE/SafE family protein [Parvibium lacunae]